MSSIRAKGCDEVHARSIARLKSEQIGWFTSIRANGFPHAVPLWLLWLDDEVLIFSEPGTVKARNVRGNPRVLLRLEVGDDGEQLTVLQGLAEISDAPTSEWLNRIGAAYGGEVLRGTRQPRADAGHHGRELQHRDSQRQAVRRPRALPVVAAVATVSARRRVYLARVYLDAEVSEISPGNVALAWIEFVLPADVVPHRCDIVLLCDPAQAGAIDSRCDLPGPEPTPILELHRFTSSQGRAWNGVFGAS